VEDLVPLSDANGQRVVGIQRTVHGVVYEIFLYRPRVEGLFARIERWVNQDTRISHWRTISRDNVTTLYGVDRDSCVADPHDPSKIFAYRISRTFDDKGNLVVYKYVPEDGAGLNLSQAHEANRSSADRAAQRYLKRILYGNASPYYPNWSTAGEETPLPADADWHFEVVFDYGDHAAAQPLSARDRPWSVRPDPFSTYRPGFEVRTYRRCQRILVLHHFADETTVGVTSLVRSTDLSYSDQVAPADPQNPIYTLLQSVIQAGYRAGASGLVRRALPPLELEYTRAQVQSAVSTLDDASFANLPEGLDGTRFQWVDLDGEGLPGVLTDLGGAWGYKRNLGPANDTVFVDGRRVANARFGAMEVVVALPSEHDLGGRLRLLDLTGDGRLDVVSLDDSAPGFFERTANESWRPFRAFESLPRVDWSEPNLKLVDLTGDGLADVFLTEDDVFTVYPSRGAAGFGAPALVRSSWDEERGPKVVLADGTQTLFLADMSGDGLSDLVRVRNGEVCYWPNLGYGRFGAKVCMDGAPRFVDDERFDPRRVRLADVDGSGTADLVYVADDGVHVCFNQSGNAWATPRRLAVFPTADNLSTVQVVDLLGNGTACLVWSSPWPGESGSPLRYVDLMGGQKPHLLAVSRNNLGAETRIRYAPSTRFYLADKEAGRPWITRLPFPVQVVERVETYDFIGCSRFVARYAYHHGHFDGYEREFRGFGMVEQWDTEEHRGDTLFPGVDAVNWSAALWAAPVLTRTWFHTGALIEAGAISQQYATEYWSEPSLAPADSRAMRLPDSVIQPGVVIRPLTGDELREAYRGLRGHALRTEVYAQDGSPRAADPYLVTEHNFTVRLEQPLGENRHPVVFVHPRESISWHYERFVDQNQAYDPRVTHDLTLEVDAFGNPARTVSVGYPRRAGHPDPDPGLSTTFRAMLAYDQQRLHVSATQHRFTTTDSTHWPDAYRTPLSSETITAELTGIAPAPGPARTTSLFRFEDFEGGGGAPGIWQTAWTGNADVPFEQIPASDVDGSSALPGTVTRRIVEQSRTVYRADDLTSLLALDELEPLAIQGETYHRALTPSLVRRVLGGRVSDATLAEAGYVQLAGSSDWWIPSGRVFLSPGDTDTPAQELAAAQAHFYLARRAVDPLGGITRVEYDAYDLLVITHTDPVANVTGLANDYRILQPSLVTDPNGNRTQAVFDALGGVAGTAVMGKTAESLGEPLLDAGFEADPDEATVAAHLANPTADPTSLLGSATARFLYDLSAYHRTRADAQPSPVVAYALTRETHVSDLGAGQTTRYQHALSYSDGFGREVQHKSQAAPESVDGAGPTASPRWIGSGWTIFDNKGNPVRKYEPFFTATSRFELARAAGVSSVLFYDPPGRVIATVHPDNTWDKTVFDPWRQETWDANDTVLISDPTSDADVGLWFVRLFGTSPGAFTSWRDLRRGGTFGTDPDDQAAQQDAAAKAAGHAATPAVVHFDALGRTCLTVEDNGTDGRYPSRVALDTQGNPLAVFDAKGRRVFEYCVREPLSAGGFQYVAGRDLAGNALYANGMDGGERRTLADVAGKPLRSWDPSGPGLEHAFSTVYDRAQRPVLRYASTGGAPPILLERLVYGEGMAAQNLCGRLYRHYDTAGLVSHDGYDFKGNLVAGMRQLAQGYRGTIDWSDPGGSIDSSMLDARAGVLLAPAEVFSSTTRYDALNRPTQSVTPHSATMRPNVVQSAYDEAGKLAAVDVWLQQVAVPQGLLASTGADMHAVTGIEYNARGQRVSLSLGNGTVTAYTYDPLTFRLTHLTTTRPTSFAADLRDVQDLAYAYDPVGNITRIHDAADIHNVIYFRNQRVEPSNDYTYDAIYRLTIATGREHLGLTNNALRAPQQVTNDDGFRTGLIHPNDGNAMGTYTESYAYDEVGNLLAMIHRVNSGSWTRRYAYSEASQITSSETSNRLSATSAPGDPDAGPYTATYDHDLHGNMVRMPHLPVMTWDEQDRLQSTTGQAVNAVPAGIPGAVPELTYYAYDCEGERLRKVTERQVSADQAAKGGVPTRRKERIYLGPVEVYREYDTDGVTPTLQRETVHVMDGERRVAIVETSGTDPGSAQLTRYQYANHLESASLELDEASSIISYEEYFPFGNTAYQAVRSQTDVSKRYRYTAKERDDENSLYYHGARYYVPWLGRWAACDPAGRGSSSYLYCGNNPVRHVDPDGADWLDVADYVVTRVARGAEWTTRQAERAAAIPVLGLVPAAFAGAVRLTQAVTGTDFEGHALNNQQRIQAALSGGLNAVTAVVGAVGLGSAARVGITTAVRSAGTSAVRAVVATRTAVAAAGGVGRVATQAVRAILTPQGLRRAATTVATHTLRGAVRAVPRAVGAAGIEATREAVTTGHVRLSNVVRAAGATILSGAEEGLASGVISAVGSTAIAALHPPADATGRPLSSRHHTVVYRAQLPPTAYPTRSEHHHFAESNRQLHAAMQSDPEWAQQLEALYPGIRAGVAPGPRGGFPRDAPTTTPDLTWHHAPEAGAMELVPTAQHQAPGAVQATLHPNRQGGMQNWGGGRR
jgi:RHS repeat-associated protein